MAPVAKKNAGINEDNEAGSFYSGYSRCSHFAGDLNEINMDMLDACKHWSTGIIASQYVHLIVVIYLLLLVYVMFKVCQRHRS